VSWLERFGLKQEQLALIFLTTHLMDLEAGLTVMECNHCASSLEAAQSQGFSLQPLVKHGLKLLKTYTNMPSQIHTNDKYGVLMPTPDLLTALNNFVPTQPSPCLYESAPH